jgi:threonine/homoserine/homoserine lactone efflux protein
MIRTATTGFGGGTASVLLAVASFRAATEFLQFVLALGGLVVLAWTIWQLSTASDRNRAEMAAAKAEERLKHAQEAQVMVRLCQDCRENRVPVTCPLPPEDRPLDCPKKDI